MQLTQALSLHWSYSPRRSAGPFFLPRLGSSLSIRACRVCSRALRGHLSRCGLIVGDIRGNFSDPSDCSFKDFFAASTKGLSLPDPGKVCHADKMVSMCVAVLHCCLHPNCRQALQHVVFAPRASKPVFQGSRIAEDALLSKFHMLTPTCCPVLDNCHKKHCCGQLTLHKKSFERSVSNTDAQSLPDAKLFSHPRFRHQLV